MVKKINENDVLIKKLIEKGYKPAYITKKIWSKKKSVTGKIHL